MTEKKTSNPTQIEVHVAELRQLYNAIDPSPFHDRDLDPNAEEFIVGGAVEAPRDAPLSMRVHLDQTTGPPTEAAELSDSVHAYFKRRAEVTRRRLREMLRRGRISLIIGLAALAALFGLSDLVSKLLAGHHIGEPIRESLLIGSWVVMWRPLEIFLYDWWPVRAEARLYDRLAKMPVTIAYQGQNGTTPHK